MKHIVYALLVCLSALAASCSSDAGRKKQILTVSIEPMRLIAEQLAAGNFEIHTLTPSGSSPETYQPTPRQMELLRNSAAYIRVGTLGFERTQLRKMTESIPHLHIVNASQRIKHLPAGDSCDPHTWTSVRNIKVIATNICDALCDLDTLNRVRHIAKLYDFMESVDSLDREIRTMLADVRQRTFLIYHPSLSYFAYEYGFEQLYVEDEGKEPSAERIARLIDECRKKRVKVVFVQKGYNTSTARRMAEEIGAEVTEINPLGYDWPAEMMKIAKALAK